MNTMETDFLATDKNICPRLGLFCPENFDFVPLKNKKDKAFGIHNMASKM